MKTYPWRDLLQRHPIFLTVRDEKRIDALLHDDVSSERTYAKDEVILRQGETGNSVFVIGVGAAEAALDLGGGVAPITLSVMRRGEVFGEMALLEGLTRSATVKAKEPCIVLEIEGTHFEGLMAEYPDIEFRLLLKMSERLRNAGEQVLRAQAGSIEEKLKIFNLKLDTEQKLVDSSVRAAQALFDQTKLRTDEVIMSAERSRDRLQKIGAVIIGFGTIAGGLLGLVGLRQVWDISQIAAEVRNIRTEADKNQKEGAKASEEVGKAREDVRKSYETIKAVHDQMSPLQGTVDSLKGQLVSIARGKVVEAVMLGNMPTAIQEYKVLQALAGVSEEVRSVVDVLEDKVFGSEPPKDAHATLVLLDEVAKGARQDANESTMVKAYFLRIAYSILTDQDSPPGRQALYAELREHLKKHPKALLDGGVLSDRVIEKIRQQRGDKAQELRTLERLTTKL